MWGGIVYVRIVRVGGIRTHSFIVTVPFRSAACCRFSHPIPSHPIPSHSHVSMNPTTSQTDSSQTATDSVLRVGGLLSLPKALQGHTFGFMTDVDASRLARASQSSQQTVHLLYRLRTIFATTLQGALSMKPGTSSHCIRFGPQETLEVIWVERAVLLSPHLCGRVSSLYLQPGTVMQAGHSDGAEALGPAPTSDSDSEAEPACLQLPCSLTALYIDAQTQVNDWTHVLRVMPRGLRHLILDGWAGYQMSAASLWSQLGEQLHSLILRSIGTPTDLRPLRALCSLRITGHFAGLSPHVALLLPESLLDLRCTGGVHWPVDSSMGDWTLPAHMHTLVLEMSHFTNELKLIDLRWPPSLTHLSLGDYGGAIHAASLPTTLRYLECALMFTEAMTDVCLPPSLQTLVLRGVSSHPSLSALRLPPSLVTLGVAFGVHYPWVRWPSGLQRLDWQGQWPWYVKPRRLQTSLPPSLTEASISCICRNDDDVLGMDHLLGPLQQPLPVLCRLRLSMHDPEHDFDWSIADVLHLTPALTDCSILCNELLHPLPSALPPLLRRLELHSLGPQETLACLTSHPCLQELSVWGFNHPLPQPLPTQLRVLQLDGQAGSARRAFNQPLHATSDSDRTAVVWPASLRVLDLGSGFNQPVANVHLPEGLEQLRFGHAFQQSDIACMRMPPLLHRLVFASNFRQTLCREQLPPNCVLQIGGGLLV